MLSQVFLQEMNGTLQPSSCSKEETAILGVLQAHQLCPIHRTGWSHTIILEKTEESRVKSLWCVSFGQLFDTIWMKCCFMLLPLNESFKRILDSFRIFESTFEIAASSFWEIIELTIRIAWKFYCISTLRCGWLWGNKLNVVNPMSQAIPKSSPSANVLCLPSPVMGVVYWRNWLHHHGHCLDDWHVGDTLCWNGIRAPWPEVLFFDEKGNQNGWEEGIWLAVVSAS